MGSPGVEAALGLWKMVSRFEPKTARSDGCGVLEISYSRNYYVEGSLTKGRKSDPVVAAGGGGGWFIWLVQHHATSVPKFPQNYIRPRSCTPIVENGVRMTCQPFVPSPSQSLSRNPFTTSDVSFPTFRSYFSFWRRKNRVLGI